MRGVGSSRGEEVRGCREQLRGRGEGVKGAAEGKR